MSYWQSLAVFTAVVEEGSFSAAAKKLEITQPTVSFHIDNLERSLGCSLFQRTARGVVVTIYGQTLLHHASKINSQLSVAQNQIKAMLEGDAGNVVLGASTIPAEYILPELVADFLRLHPRLQFTMHTGDSQSVLTGFQRGDYSIAIIGAYPKDYPVIKLWEDELILVAHPALKAELGHDPGLEKILAQPFVSRGTSSGSMRAVLTALEKFGVSEADLRVVFRVGGNEALKSAILRQVGLGFTSRWAVQNELDRGELEIIDIEDLKITRPFYAVCREPLLPNCLALFWNFLTNYALASQYWDFLGEKGK